MPRHISKLDMNQFLQMIHDNLGNFILDVVFLRIFTEFSIVFFLKLANMCITK